jgi:hypothetical protein
LPAHQLLPNPRSIHVQWSRHCDFVSGTVVYHRGNWQAAEPALFLAAVRYNSGNNSGIPAASGKIAAAVALSMKESREWASD